MQCMRALNIIFPHPSPSRSVARSSAFCMPVGWRAHRHTNAIRERLSNLPIYYASSISIDMSVDIYLYAYEYKSKCTQIQIQRGRASERATDRTKIYLYVLGSTHKQTHTQPEHHAVSYTIKVAVVLLPFRLSPHSYIGRWWPQCGKTSSPNVHIENK